MRPCIRIVLLALAAALLVACSALRRGELPWSAARQLILVTTADWEANRGSLRRYERDRRGWREVGAEIPVVIGRNGAAWGIGLHPPQAGLQKREGDGRSPAGVFALGTAFGYGRSAPTDWPYAAMSAGDYCIDVDGSPWYNRIVDAGAVGAEAVAGSTEPMRRDLHLGGDQRYRLGFVIEHNPQGARGAGSCIFAHLWHSDDTSTAGCTAMAEPAMRELLRWLQPRAHPAFALLPRAEYARLYAAWALPAPDRP